jgi:hypothetical protein
VGRELACWWRALGSMQDKRCTWNSCTTLSNLCHALIRLCTAAATLLCTSAPLPGKTTFLRALSTNEIPGLPPSCQVLHVEQEVVGDDTPVLQVRGRGAACDAGLGQSRLQGACKDERVASVRVHTAQLLCRDERQLFRAGVSHVTRVPLTLCQITRTRATQLCLTLVSSPPPSAIPLGSCPVAGGA